MHLLAESRYISRSLDDSFPAVVMLIQLLPEAKEHGHERIRAIRRRNIRLGPRSTTPTLWMRLIGHD